jgi:hypothetical protein
LKIRPRKQPFRPQQEICYASTLVETTDTDWLAFGHIMVAFFFIGPWRNPIANEWVLRIGLVCCAAFLPLALICGQIRGIPSAGVSSTAPSAFSGTFPCPTA